MSPDGAKFTTRHCAANDAYRRLPSTESPGNDLAHDVAVLSRRFGWNVLHHFDVDLYPSAEPQGHACTDALHVALIELGPYGEQYPSVFDALLDYPELPDAGKI